MNKFNFRNIGEPFNIDYGLFQCVINNVGISIVRIKKPFDLEYYRIYIHKHEGKNIYKQKNCNHFNLEKAKQEAIELYEDYINENNK